MAIHKTRTDITDKRNITEFKGMVGLRYGNPGETSPIPGEEVDGRPDLDPTQSFEIDEYWEDFFDDTDNG